jgi:uncharacterized protein YndB with AHSA1/START domain
MRSPDGHVAYNGGEFRDIVHLESIVWLWHFADADGNRVSPAHYGFPHEDREGNIDEVLFEDYRGSQTKLTYRRNDPTATEEERRGVAEGYAQTFEKFADVVAVVMRQRKR